MPGHLRAVETPEDLWTCHECGWTYPNHHPSAKHRRNHKKVCGFLPGFIGTPLGSRPTIPPELEASMDDGASSDDASSDDENVPENRAHDKCGHHHHHHHHLHQHHHPAVPAVTTGVLLQHSNGVAAAATATLHSVLKGPATNGVKGLMLGVTHLSDRSLLLQQSEKALKPALQAENKVSTTDHKDRQVLQSTGSKPQHARRRSAHALEGVWRCRHCGWTYPNAHPSAKHRRKHKKKCPTLAEERARSEMAAAGGSSSEESDEDNRMRKAAALEMATDPETIDDLPMAMSMPSNLSLEAFLSRSGSMNGGSASHSSFRELQAPIILLSPRPVSRRDTFLSPRHSRSRDGPSILLSPRPALRNSKAVNIQAQESLFATAEMKSVFTTNNNDPENEATTVLNLPNPPLPSLRSVTSSEIGSMTVDDEDADDDDDVGREALLLLNEEGRRSSSDESDLNNSDGEAPRSPVSVLHVHHILHPTTTTTPDGAENLASNAEAVIESQNHDDHVYIPQPGDRTSPCTDDDLQVAAMEAKESEVLPIKGEEKLGNSLVSSDNAFEGKLNTDTEAAAANHAVRGSSDDLVAQDTSSHATSVNLLLTEKFVGGSNCEEVYPKADEARTESQDFLESTLEPEEFENNTRRTRAVDTNAVLETESKADNIAQDDAKGLQNPPKASAICDTDGSRAQQKLCDLRNSSAWLLVTKELDTREEKGQTHSASLHTGVHLADHLSVPIDGEEIEMAVDTELPDMNAKVLSADQPPVPVTVEESKGRPIDQLVGVVGVVEEGVKLPTLDSAGSPDQPWIVEVSEEKKSIPTLSPEVLRDMQIAPVKANAEATRDKDNGSIRTSQMDSSDLTRMDPEMQENNISVLDSLPAAKSQTSFLETIEVGSDSATTQPIIPASDTRDSSLSDPFWEVVSANAELQETFGVKPTLLVTPPNDPSFETLPTPNSQVVVTGPGGDHHHLNKVREAKKPGQKADVVEGHSTSLVAKVPESVATKESSDFFPSEHGVSSSTEAGEFLPEKQITSGLEASEKPGSIQAITEVQAVVDKLNANLPTSTNMKGQESAPVLAAVCEMKLDGQVEKLAIGEIPEDSINEKRAEARAVKSQDAVAVVEGEKTGDLAVMLKSKDQVGAKTAEKSDCDSSKSDISEPKRTANVGFGSHRVFEGIKASSLTIQVSNTEKAPERRLGIFGDWRAREVKDQQKTREPSLSGPKMPVSGKRKALPALSTGQGDGFPVPKKLEGRVGGKSKGRDKSEGKLRAKARSLPPQSPPGSPPRSGGPGSPESLVRERIETYERLAGKHLLRRTFAIPQKSPQTPRMTKSYTHRMELAINTSEHIGHENAAEQIAAVVNQLHHVEPKQTNVQETHDAPDKLLHEALSHLRQAVV